MRAGKSNLKDSMVLDAGSGNGRLTSAIGEFCKEVIGMDLSQGVEISFHNNTKYAR